MSNQPLPTDRRLLIGLLLANALLRLSLLGVNKGEYTDGILQITQFERTDSFWPPLYTALVWLLRQAGLEGIAAGRLVSWAAAVALVVPLWSVARAWAGRSAALYACVLYTAAPLALRWSQRAMTDMLFVFLFHAACAALLSFWADWRRAARPDSRGDSAQPAGERVRTASSPRSPTLAPPPSAARSVARITILACLATLTRYQGLMLAPLVAAALVCLWRARGRAGGGSAAIWPAVLAQLLWLTLPAWWLFHQRFGHLEQIADRMAPADLWATLVNYWSIFEMFLYVTPYVLTLPVFAFLTIGLVSGPGASADEPRGPNDATPPPRARMPVRLLFLYATFAVLAAQSVFQSFQTRYLLPLLPLALVCAGTGMARAEETLTRQGRGGKALFLTLVTGTLVWSMGFALASVMLQRGAFGDLFDAGRYVATLEDLPDSARVYTNESYGGKAGMHGINLAYASGRETKPIPEAAYWFLDRPCPPDLPAIEPGSILALSSRNSFGMRGHLGFIAFLEKRYDLTPLPEPIFRRETVPLLPDIMGEPGSEQNPLAWALLRYRKQHFETRLYRVGPRR